MCVIEKIVSSGDQVMVTSGFGAITVWTPQATAKSVTARDGRIRSWRVRELRSLVQSTLRTAHVSERHRENREDDPTSHRRGREVWNLVPVTPMSRQPSLQGQLKFDQFRAGAPPKAQILSHICSIFLGSPFHRARALSESGQFHLLDRPGPGTRDRGCGLGPIRKIQSR